MVVSTAADADLPSAGEEWRSNWGLLLAAVVGISFGAVPGITLGLFMEPLEAEFGWSRSMISGGMMVYAVFGLLLAPFAGALVDNVGPRRCVLPGLAGCALSFGSLGLMTGMPWQWWAGWVGYGFFSLLIRSVVWNSAISHAFTQSRGLAISFVLGGFGIAQILGPMVAHTLIDAFGWRNAYLILGVGWPGTGFVLALLLFKTKRTRGGSNEPEPDFATQRLAKGGLTLGEAFRTPTVLRITFATVLTMTIAASVSIHGVLMLEANGIDLGVAAATVGMVGIGSLTGNLGAGWLTDKVGGSIVPAIVYGMPALGCLLLWFGGTVTILLGIGVFCFGFGSGGSLQMATYLTTRHAGLRHFGKIFGLMSSGVAFAGGLGPLLTGFIYDTTGSYTLFFMIALPAAIISGLAVVGLGPYPAFEPVRAESANG